VQTGVIARAASMHGKTLLAKRLLSNGRREQLNSREENEKRKKGTKVHFVP
jgi:hypothetical protein